MGNRDWTGKEEKRFKELYPHFTNKFLSVIFDRSILAMKHKGQRLVITKILNPSRIAPYHENIRTKRSTLNIEASKKLGREKKIRIAGLRDKYGLTKIIGDINI